jgi:hypothetical protein
MRLRKPQRNAKPVRFRDEGIFINMLRCKIVKSRRGGIAGFYMPQSRYSGTAKSGFDMGGT